MPQPMPGMQAERTALAWQRTGLSVVVGAAVLARLTYGDLGPWVLLALAACLGLCGWMLVDTRRGGRRRGGRGPAHPRIGRWAAAVAASVVVLGLTELVALVVG